MTSRFRGVVAIAALVAGACAAGRPHDAAFDRDYQALVEAARALDAASAEVDRLLDGPVATVDCQRACALADTICQLAERICRIAARNPTSREAAARCDDARARCRRARERVAARCRCQQELL